MIKKKETFLQNYFEGIHSKFFIVLLIFFIFATAMLLPQTVNAVGGVGGGGDPGGGSSGAQTKNGFGWYKYEIGVESPVGMKTGNWANVVQICNDAGAKSVVAFTVLNKLDSDGGNPDNNGVIYNYSSAFGPNIEWWTNYNGNNGGNWIRLDDAQAMFNELSTKYDVNTTGYTWHLNVAWFCWTLPQNDDWAIAATSSITSGVTNEAGTNVAIPGSTVVWRHTVSSAGTDTNEPVNSSITKTTTTISNGSVTTNSGLEAGTTPSGTAPGVIRNISGASTSHAVTQADVGKIICEWVVFNPVDSKSSASGTGNIDSCVTVKYNYNLIPTVSANPSGIIEGGSSFTVTTNITNNGNTVNDTAAEWLLERVETVDETTVPDGSWQNYGIGSGLTIAANSSFQPTVPFVDSDTDKAVGIKVCYRLSVRPYDSTSVDWRRSIPACVTVGKKPKVQVWGGNLVSGAGISTSASRKIITGRSYIFGSWAEYGIFAVGTIDGMASASAFAGGLDLGLGATTYSGNACTYSNLSFANTPLDGSYCASTTGSIGNYSFNYPMRDVAASFSSEHTISSAAIVANDLLSEAGTYVGQKTDNLTLNTSTLDQAKSAVLIVDGDVTITGNQNYANVLYASAAQLPQLIIIANNIYITDNVTNIDAWLIASGTINTCSNAVGNLTVDKCSQRLTINGPVNSGVLELNRTAGSGSGANSGDPAEVFNLRADTILWSAAHADTRNIIQSVYTNELPPRF